MRIFQLLCFNESIRIELKCFDNSMNFDSSVQIIFYKMDKKYILLDDILGYALSELVFHFMKTDGMEIVSELLTMEIGRAENEYYHRCAEDLPLDIPAVRENEEGHWIGSCYNCFESKHFSTWVYHVKGEVVFKITPHYPCYEDEPECSYDEFITNYKIIYCKVLQKKEIFQCENMIERIKNLVQY